MDKTTFYEKIEEDLIFDDINEVKVNSAGRKIEPWNPPMETPPRRVGAFFYKVKKLKIPQSLYKKEWIIKGRRRLSYNSEDEERLFSKLLEMRRTRKIFRNVLKRRSTQLKIKNEELQRERREFIYGMNKLKDWDRKILKKLNKVKENFLKNYLNKF